MPQQTRAVLIGTGHYLPARIVTSAEVEAAAGKPPGWAVKRVGIEERRVAAPDELSWHMGTHAARDALKRAGKSAADIDLLLVHSSASELYYPDVAWFLARDLGVPDSATVLGLRSACAGFLGALKVAEQFLKTGSAKCALIVCTERMFRPAQSYERSAVLFGDGAAAAVLVAGTSGGLRHVHLGQKSAGADRSVMANPLLHPDARAAVCPDLPGEWADRALPEDGSVTFWEGRDIFQNAVLRMGEATEAALSACGLTVPDIDHFLYHQANFKILKSLMRNFDLPRERVHTNIATVGNISSATVPCLLSQGIASGRIQPGQRVLMAAFGVGYTFGAAVLEV
ncbi:MAG: 3-oxoacyl-[acyl-carrier-protein] synthase-3 [Myxococcota bacterium]|jgi:3-oxoacyl-[acyl-carrier-protein] synthase-3